jgi:hypothetical protein
MAGTSVLSPHQGSASPFLLISYDQRVESLMQYIPAEFAIGGVYFPPLFIAGILGVVAASVTARLFNRYRLSRFFFYPPLVFVALAVIFTGLFGTFVVRV